MTYYKHGASLRGGETTHSASKISDTDVATLIMSNGSDRGLPRALKTCLEFMG